MSKKLQTLMMTGALVALTACGGGGGGGSSESSSTPSSPPASGIGTYAFALSKPSVISPSGTVVLTVTLTNTSSLNVTRGALNISLPAGSKSISAVAVGAPCTSTGLSVGDSGFILTGLVVPVGATCTNAITLTPSTPGLFSFPGSASFMSYESGATLTIM